jgi:hypothetical protein
MNESAKRVNVVDEGELNENDPAITEPLEDSPTYTADLDPGRRWTCSPRVS